MCRGPQCRWFLRPAGGSTHAQHHQGGGKSVRVHQLWHGTCDSLPQTMSHSWNYAGHGNCSHSRILQLQMLRLILLTKVKILIMYWCTQKRKWSIMMNWQLFHLGIPEILVFCIHSLCVFSQVIKIYFSFILT